MFRYSTKKDKELFVDKMTKINKERCNTKEFKDNMALKTKNRFKDENIREEHSIKIRKAWSDPILRKKQSDKIKQWYAKQDSPVCRNGSPCMITLNGETKVFDMVKDCQEYIKNKYGVAPSRVSNVTKPYKSNLQKMKCLEGLVFQYIKEDID